MKTIYNNQVRNSLISNNRKIVVKDLTTNDNKMNSFKNPGQASFWNKRHAIPQIK